MSRVIPDAVQGDFAPMVGLRNKGNFVKGKVKAIGQTNNGNPAVTLTLIDMDGSTSVAKSKGVYEEVDVNPGDDVQVIGSLKQLREKLPQLAIGEIVTISYLEKVPLKGGKSLYKFKVEVE